MKILKYIKIGVPVLLIIVLVLFLHKNLPRTAVVQITGTDIKRIDQRSKKPKTVEETNKNETMAKTTDVRFINAISKKGRTMVFRNEDTGWGWPPYFKFNSADLTAEAQAFSLSTQEMWVFVKYYGWRIRIFSMFPNAVSLKEADRSYKHFPLFNVAFVSLLIILGFLIKRKYKKLIEWIRGNKKSPSNPAD